MSNHMAFQERCCHLGRVFGGGMTISFSTSQLEEGECMLIDSVGKC